jgi:hypothetical protein
MVRHITVPVPMFGLGRTPKTVSNLHLVPKYEGVKDATKASTYLAGVKGTKNKQFRIVQDLRRINKVTRNVKRSLPKLPEHIFQKLKNKIVSSVDRVAGVEYSRRESSLENSPNFLKKFPEGIP